MGLREILPSTPGELAGTVARFGVVTVKPADC